MKNILLGFLLLASTLLTQGATITISNWDGVPNQNIGVNIPNQPLGGFSVNVTDVPARISSLDFDVAPSTAVHQLTSISVYDSSGTIVAGPVDAREVTGRYPILFTDPINAPVGNPTYIIKGKVGTGMENGETITLMLKGISYAPTHEFDMQFPTLGTMTVRRASLNVGINNPPDVGPIVPGSYNKVVYFVTLDAVNSIEDIRMGSLPLFLDVLDGCIPTYLTGCQLFDGAIALNTGVNIVNPSQSGRMYFTFDSSLVIAKGTTKTLALKCNVSQSAHGEFVWSLTSPMACVGVTSGMALEATPVVSTILVMQILGLPSFGRGNLDFSISNGVGNFTVHGTWNYRYQIEESFDLHNWHAISDMFTVAHISLPVATNAYAFYRFQEFLPSRLTVSSGLFAQNYHLVVAGTIGVMENAIRFHAEYEDVNFQSLGLKLGFPGESSASDLTQATFWDGEVQVGTAIFTGGSTSAIVTFISPVRIVKGVDKVLIIRADLAPIGVAGPVTVSGHRLSIEYDDEHPDRTYGVGADSGQTIQAFGSTKSLGVRIMKSFPTVEIDALPATGVDDGRLMRFKVTASTAGPIGIGRVTFLISAVGCRVQNANMDAYYDSAYSQRSVALFSSQTGVGELDSITNVSFLSWVVPQQSSAEIPAGATWYFELRGTVVPNSGATTYGVGAKLKGDEHFPWVYPKFMDTFWNIDGFGSYQGYQNFIWSPNSSGISNLTDPDWTNGYAVPGLPLEGITQVRTN